MTCKKRNNNCHPWMFLMSIQETGCPTEAFGHEDFILFGADLAVLNLDVMILKLKSSQ